MNEQMFKHEWVNVKKNQRIDLQYDQSTFSLSHSCGLGRLKWMAYYEGGACACQSEQNYGQYFIIDTAEVYVVHV